MNPSESKMLDALLRYEEEMLAALPTEEALAEVQAFSADFQARMQEVIETGSVAREAPKRPRPLRRRVAVAALVFVLAAASLMSVEAIRVQVLGFLLEVFETHTRVTFDPRAEDLPETLEEYYRPWYVPEGFVLVNEVRDSEMQLLSYVHESDETHILRIRQTIISPSAFQHLNTENTQLEEITVDKRSYLYYENLGIHSFMWEENGYMLRCSGTLSKEEVLRVAENFRIGEQGTQPSTILTHYSPDYVPEGYHLSKRIHHGAQSIFEYRHEANETELLTAEQYTASVAIHLNTEGSDAEELVVGERVYLYSSTLGMQTLIWEENDYVFICAGVIPKEELLKVAVNFRSD